MIVEQVGCVVFNPLRWVGGAACAVEVTVLVLAETKICRESVSVYICSHMQVSLAVFFR